MSVGLDREAQRQGSLLAALRGDPAAAAGVPCVRERGERRQQGLAAYRANAHAIAERALSAGYPTVQALLGAEDFAALARALWAASPPLRGDLAQWGADLPDFIAAQRDLDAWPYLADCARLDAALQACEAAADATLDRDSLALLAAHPPAALRLVLQPCVRLLASAWPIATIHAAHRLEADVAAEAFEAARAAIAARTPECVAVAREGWRGTAVRVSAADHAWMAALDRGVTLDLALHAAAPLGFELDPWLLRALRHGWLCKAEAVSAD